jgi:hypothetical protein
MQPPATVRPATPSQTALYFTITTPKITACPLTNQHDASHANAMQPVSSANADNH